MHTLTRRIVCLAMTGALAITGLAGCAGQAGQAGQAKEPTSAAELAEMSEKTPGAKNYHFEGNLELNLDIAGQALPLKTTVVGDTVDGSTHFTTNTEFLGEKQQNETYLVKENNTYTQYASSNESGTVTWTKMAIDSNPFESLSSKELLSQGEFSKVDNGYTITLTGNQILDTVKKANKDVENALKDIDTTDLQKALENCKIVFTFDKAANITGEAFNIDYSAKSEIAGQPVEMKIKLALDAKLSDHGKVDASKVALPENVKSGAVDAGAGLNDLLKQFETLGGTTSGATSTSTQSAA